MRNVLVTGSNGQLASCIKDLAKEQKGLHFIYTDYQELDICNLKQVDKFFKTNQKLSSTPLTLRRLTVVSALVPCGQ